MLNLTSKQFAEKIEHIVQTEGISYIDAVTEWCWRNNFELESAAKLVRRNKDLKEKMEQQAKDLNLVSDR